MKGIALILVTVLSLVFILPAVRAMQADRETVAFTVDEEKPTPGKADAGAWKKEFPCQFAEAITFSGKSTRFAISDEFARVLHQPAPGTPPPNGSSSL